MKILAICMFALISGSSLNACEVCGNFEEVAKRGIAQIQDKYILVNERLNHLNLEECTVAQYYYMKGQRDAYGNALIYLRAFEILE